MTRKIWHLKGDTSAAVGTSPVQGEGTDSKTWTGPNGTPAEIPAGGRSTEVRKECRRDPRNALH